ncbi:amino acid adenylation domain-containing protein [Streptomyces tubercidicus]|uniref:amino acid adenylation domain-containing protein n=1 Tax=Streptomyces tubercidicus TaxID=47759 RepID=UPI003692BABC
MPVHRESNRSDREVDTDRLGELLTEINDEFNRAVGSDEPLFLQSLDATWFKTAIETHYGVDVPLEMFFGACTLGALVEAIRTVGAADTGEAAPRLVPAPEERFAPFPLTDVQQAYYLGARGFELGGRSAHFYTEIDLFAAEAERVEEVFNQLIARHDMLRAIVLPDGRQRILPEVPSLRIPHEDLRDVPEATARCRLAQTRQEMAEQVLDPHTWPLYDIRTHGLGGGRLRLHVSIDLLFLDAGSLYLLFGEWIRAVLDPSAPAPPLELSFRDYLTGVAAHRRTPAYDRARAYWLDRVDTLPLAPGLPARPPAGTRTPVFVRRERRLPGRVWRGVRERANALGVTPSVLLCTAYAEVLRTWSRSPHFTITLTLAERPTWHPDIQRLIGDFTSTVLLECDLAGSPGPATTASRLQKRLREDLAHTAFSGVEVQREIARRRDGGTRARMPVVFTSLLRDNDGLGALEGVVFESGYALSQTPQVYLDNQVQVRGEELVVSWDAVEEVFPPGVLDDMFAAYVDLAERWAGEEVPARPGVPGHQLAVRAVVNGTAGPAPYELLHAAVDRMAAARPGAPAVLSAARTLTYGELDRRANQVARRLRGLGARPGSLVAVVMRKGWEQVVGVLGVLRAGAAYLPVDADLPPERVTQLITAGRAAVALTQPGVTPPDGVTTVVVGPQTWPEVPDGPLEAPATAPDDLAYVIFTSGSTGRPKGVMTSHRAAVNTLDDISTRWAVGPGDRLLGLSSLSFDLSVYDVFGVLGAGGALVLPAPDESRDPDRWADLADTHGVTLWNTVPALLELLVERCERRRVPFPASVRLLLLSGDWIPVPLPDRLRAIHPGTPEIIGLGGATEAAVWSIHHPVREVDPAWPSIPYGTPLRNQTFHVLDADLADVPDHVTGELYIGGAGVALGYWDDPARTAESFRNHPETGGRLYRTGDLGRYLPDGSIEFQGREDHQVKIAGHRIELGEIETVLGGHPAVRRAAVVVQDARRLVAYVVPEDGAAPAHDTLHDHLTAWLPSYMVPQVFVSLESFPLSPNGKVDRSALPEPSAAGPADAPPATPAEAALARAWTAVLPVAGVGRHDNFFTLGGDSLLGMRAVAKAAESGLHLTLKEFFVHPTIVEQAAVARPGPTTAAPQSAVTGRAGLSPSQQWFFAQDFADPDHWNGMWPVFELDRPLDPALLDAALTTVLAHHDGLRARFRHDDGGWYADLPGTVPQDTARVQVVDLADVADAEAGEAVRCHVDRRNGGLDLSRGHTVRLTCFDLGPHRRARLLVSAHWLVMDYYSSRIFYEDLRSAYFALERGDTPALPSKTASVRQCAEQLTAYAASEELLAELPYWSRIADAADPRIPVDHLTGFDVQSSAVRHFVEIAGDTATALVTGLPRQRGVEIREVLLTALARAVTAWTGRPEALVELEGHGRQEAFGTLDISRTVGRFSTLSPVLLRPGSLGAVRDQLRAVPNRGVGYGLLRHLHPDHGVRERLSRVPAPEIGFNFWGDVSEYFTEDARPVTESFGHHRSERGHRPRTLDVMAFTSDGTLHLVWTYSTRRHTEKTVRALADRVTEELYALAKEAE